MHRDRDMRREPRLHVPSGLGTVRYAEDLLVPRALLKKVELPDLATAGWVPIEITDTGVLVAAVAPHDPAVAQAARQALGVENVELLAISPEDLARVIANNLDVNPGFPPQASRTDLARVRTYLANRRSFLASRRTAFSKGRTGLAILRTGLALLTAVLLLVRIFGTGWSSPVELGLLLAALALVAEGFAWYLPARRLSRRRLRRGLPPALEGPGFLRAMLQGGRLVFERLAIDPEAAMLRHHWEQLSPVMRRRFLALERTDLAEERTHLAFCRTLMAMSRTGMALGRTGIALAGIGIALVRQFHHHFLWGACGWLLIATGVLMTLEGLSWYRFGRRAGRESIACIAEGEDCPTVWDLVLDGTPDRNSFCRTSLRQLAGLFVPGSRPGIWGSTGLALERTLLAERRNVMARLRTHMARGRTGLAFIRTGMNCTAVGLGLLVSFGFRSTSWAVLETLILGLGIVLVTDGLRWFLPAESLRQRLPFCVGDMEIPFPDYTRPMNEWPKVTFDDAS